MSSAWVASAATCLRFCNARRGCLRSADGGWPIPQRLNPGGPDSRIAVTVLVQFTATSEADLADGRASVVLNGVYPGCGSLSARHAFGDSAYHRRLRRVLREWLVSIHAPAEPIDIVLSGDCNSLQAHPRLTRRVLAWPIEPCNDVEAVTISFERLATSRPRFRPPSGPRCERRRAGANLSRDDGAHPTLGIRVLVDDARCSTSDPSADERDHAAVGSGRRTARRSLAARSVALSSVARRGG